eukprot:TRINITY_DN5490_c0_g3_i2.p1 TRINITY_DN5490_c0_g3~~TRINITY_DN5490_c0_g3_i2.p1  ORF type:complete len:554 (+),score=65.41 TRINITY_DN5490_c0_g3_i2:71-1732(+)
MHPDDIWSVVIISLSLPTVIVFFSALIYKTLQGQRCRDAPSVSKRCSPSSCCERSDRSELEVKVASLERRRAIEFNRRAIMSIAPTAAVVLCMVVILKIFDWTSDSMVPFKDGHTVCILFGLFVSVICLIFDDQPSDTCSCIVHISILGRLAWIQASYPNGFAVFSDKQYVLMLRLGASMIVSKNPLIYVTNLILACVSFATIWYHWRNDERFATAHSEQAFLAHIFIQEFVAYVFVLVVCRTFSQERLKEARATVDANTSQHLFSAASRLISMIYDVVVEIDEARLVVGQATNLAGMLLHGTNRSLEGKCLVDFILPGRDRQLFEDMLLSTSSVPIKLRLKDTLGSVVNVEMFHTRYDDLDDLAHHLIGIREVESHAVASDLDLTSLDELQQATEIATGAGQVLQSAEQGTRAQILSGDLLEVQSTASSGSKRSRCEQPSRTVLLFPQKEETSTETRVISMLSVLKHWNAQIPVVSCCSYHALLLEARDTLKHMKHVPCRDLGGMCLPSACPLCGLTSEDVDQGDGVDDDGCLVCTDGFQKSDLSVPVKVSL